MIRYLFTLLLLLTSLSPAFADPTAFTYHDIKLTPNTTLITKTQHDENSDAHYTIDISYPQIAGANLDASAQQFNKTISDSITKANTQFTMQIVNPTGASIPAELQKNSLHIDYVTSVVHVNNQTVLSVRFYELTSFAGTAHPQHTIEVLNYNLTDGAQIQLGDLFKTNSNYLNVISNYCKDALKKTLQDADSSMIDEGAAADAKNFTNWILQPQGLLVLFSEYQVAPYVSGMPEILIPYAALQSVVAADAVIAPCTKNPTLCK